MSSFHNAKHFTTYSKNDAKAFKKQIREQANGADDGAKSWSTISHTLQHCAHFYSWLLETDVGSKISKDLPGFFNLNRREQKLSKIPKPRDIPTLKETLDLHQAMGSKTPCQRRDQAMLSIMACSGIRVDAVVSLLGEDMDWENKKLNQNPNHVRTKNSKHMKTWLIHMHPVLFESIKSWLDERSKMGLGPLDPLFPPDRYLNEERFRRRRSSPIPCWSTPHPIQKCMQKACARSKHAERKFTPHTLRGMIIVHLLNTPMMARGLVALSKNLGHASIEVTLRAYANMTDEDFGKEIAGMNCEEPTCSETDLDLIRAFHLHLIPFKSHCMLERMN